MILIALIVGFILGRITIGNYEEPKRKRKKKRKKTKHEEFIECCLRDGHGN